jgi:hypothetical protein
MNRLIPILALVTAAVSVGCTWTINIAVYRTWVFVPAAAFPQYQQAHELRFVPLAVLFGLSSIVFAVMVAWRGLPNVPRTPLWIAAVLALVPWIVTPIFFIPLQGQLSVAGPTPDLVNRLVNASLVLRDVPPTLQMIILCWAVLQSFNVAHAQQGNTALHAHAERTM